jgi:hypothetical protein
MSTGVTVSAHLAIAASGALALLAAVRRAGSADVQGGHLKVFVQLPSDRDGIYALLDRKQPVYTIVAPNGQEAVITGWQMDNWREMFDRVFRGQYGQDLLKRLTFFAKWIESLPWPMRLYRGAQGDSMDRLQAVDATEGTHRGSHWTPNPAIAQRFALGQHGGSWRIDDSAGGAVYETVVDDLEMIDWTNTVYYYYRYTFPHRPWSDEIEEQINLRPSKIGQVALRSTHPKSTGSAVLSGGPNKGVRGAPALPAPSPAPPGMKPRWASSWSKGQAWAREQAAKRPLQWSTSAPLDALADEDLTALRQALLTLGNPVLLEERLRLGLAFRVRPAALRAVRDLSAIAGQKLREALTADQRAFWSGVAAYDGVVAGWASAEADPVELEGLLDAVEIELVKEWLKNRKKA